MLTLSTKIPSAMAFAFAHGEPVGEAIQRILIEQIDRAIAQLADPKRKLATRIHDVRKRFKEIRAVLRLVRKPLGHNFASENIWFRDAGRELGSLRDADALVEAAIKLRENVRSIGDKRLLTRVRRTLQQRQDVAAAPLANVTQQLPVAKARLANLPVLDDRFATIGAGLERTYALGRRGFLRSSISASPDDVHEWRKRVKDHWYHVLLLGNVWPDIMTPYAEVMGALSRTLGDLHDLDVLNELVTVQPSLFGSMRSAQRLLSIIGARRTTLLNEALEIGGRVYAEEPAAWRRRVRGYWRSWRG
jgi:CHAD domain-containing protein